MIVSIQRLTRPLRWQDVSSLGFGVLARFCLIVGCLVVVFVTAVIDSETPGEPSLPMVVEADVVRFVPGAWWNPLDDGQAIVGVDRGGQRMTESVEYVGTVREVGPGGVAEVWFDPDDPASMRPLATATDDGATVGAFVVFVSLTAAAVALADLLRLIGRAMLAGRRRAHWRRSGGEVRLTNDHVPVGLPLVPANGGAAMQHGPAQDALRRYRRRWLIVGAVAAGVLLLGGVVSHAMAVKHAHDLVGVERVSGTVVGGGSEGFRLTRSWVDVSYDANGRDLVGKLYGSSVDDMPSGTQVTVLYDSENPEQFRTPDETNEPRSDLLLYLLVPGVMIAGAFVVAGVRWAQMTRWMRVVPWCTWIATDGSRRGQGWYAAGPVELTAVDANGARHEVMVRSAWSTNFGTAENWRPRGETALYLPGPGRRGVVLPDGAEIPFRVRLPRTLRQHRRWRRTIDKHLADSARTD